MKKLFLASSFAVCLLFTATVTPIRADDGNGHDAGYVCVETETVSCPPDSAAPLRQGETFTSNIEVTDDEDVSVNLLELVITLILKS